MLTNGVMGTIDIPDGTEQIEEPLILSQAHVEVVDEGSDERRVRFNLNPPFARHETPHGAPPILWQQLQQRPQGSIHGTPLHEPQQRRRLRERGPLRDPAMLPDVGGQHPAQDVTVEVAAIVDEVLKSCSNWTADEVDEGGSVLLNRARPRVRLQQPPRRPHQRRVSELLLEKLVE